MILGPVSYLDCIVFCVFLAPQLIWQAGLFRTIFHASRAVPFLGEIHLQNRQLLKCWMF